MRNLLLIVVALLAACAGPAATVPVGVRMDGEIAQIVRGEPGHETTLALFRGVRRWAAGDVTGDGRIELVLLWSLPDRPPRVWVVRPDDAGVTPVWRGSGMAGIPLDVALEPAADGARLLVLEDWDGHFQLVRYRWDAFGFRGEAWGAVGPGALAAGEAGGIGFLPDGEEQSCPVETRDRQLLLRCPRR
ncbi:MAG: hypothetical protein ABIK09_10255 [Pseudomonadota bacterium]